MNLELTSESSLITFHANENADILGEEVEVRPLPDKDYSSFMADDLDDINWSNFKDLAKGYRDDPPGGTSVDPSAAVASEVETSDLDQSIVRDVLDVRVTLRFQSVDEGDPLGPRVVVVVERCLRGVCVSDDIDSSGGTVPAESNGRERQGFV
ncbi:hypothetical protein LWI29_037605 [Acer saccharum]|uniref:Uncharacterized protein n=1 Tax=Acer saccharum TaxID=4024 RepID=A0AA39S282_ACESA|nr:hypothetical protein LWI29_037605 [Acer saccharum]